MAKVSHVEIDKVLTLLAKARQKGTMLGRISEKYDSFKVLISTILSARAKDEMTEVISEKLFKKYPDVKSLATADKKAVIKIIKSIGFYNNKAKNIIGAAKMLVGEFNGKVPDAMEDLVKFPGVGRKVANCVLVYSFAKNAIPVDIHVHRISNRLGWVKTKTPEQTEEELMKLVPKKHWQIINETLVMHGKTICVPISPFCSKCPVYKNCRRIGVEKSR